MTYEWTEKVIQLLGERGINGNHIAHSSITLSDYVGLTPEQAVNQIIEELDAFYQDLSETSMMEATQ